MDWLNSISDFFNIELFKAGDYVFTLDRVVIALSLVLLAPILFWLLNRIILIRYFKRREIKEGRKFAVTSLLRYVFYFIIFLMAIQVVGVELSVVWAGAAALLLGIGLGLQQTFNDFASGIILLLEGTVQKGDWIEAGDMQGQILRIGLRTSHILTRGNVSIIIPNSKITVDNVVNLSHISPKVRYEVEVGVAYGSDVKMVKELLLKCADRHSLVLKKPLPFVRFTNFGDSALMFQILFWSEDFIHINDIKSDIRFMIDNEFRNHHIRIPFPQRDLHIVSSTSIPFAKEIEEKKEEDIQQTKKHSN